LIGGSIAACVQFENGLTSYKVMKTRLYNFGINFHLPKCRLVILLVMIASALSLAGCVSMQDAEVSQVYRADQVGVITSEQDLGQSFISRRSGLNSVQVYLRPLGEQTQWPDQVLTLRLFHSPQDATPLAQSRLTLQALAQQNPMAFNFTPQNDPPQTSYYLELSVDSGQVAVSGRNDDQYPDGQLYVDGTPQDKDISFSTSYDYGLAAAWLDLQTWLSRVWLLFPLLLGLWLPGRLLLRLTRFDGRLDVAERVAISVGLSLSLTPTLMIWTTLLGLRWTAGSVWAGALILLAGYLWLQREALLHFFRNLGSYRPNPILLALLAVVLFSSGLRLAMVRDLSASPWVDSIQHAMITQMIVEQGRFPASYAPYIQLDTASYHSGFHSNLAVFLWLSGLDVATGMLWFGQVLNALMVLAAYQFTKLATRSGLAGVIAALICGVFTPMPAYYTSWGRYTQLAGLLILPTAITFIAYIFKTSSGERRWAFLLAVLAASGLTLTHYRVLAFMVCLVLPFLLVSFLSSLGEPSQRKDFLRGLAWLAGAGLATILLTLPWIPATLETLVLPRSGVAAQPPSFFSDFAWGYLNSAWGQQSLWLATGGLLLALLRRWKLAVVLALWVGLMFLLANLGALRLPGGNFINNSSVEISLFLPVAALGGYFVADLFDLARAHLPAWGTPALAGLLVLGSAAVAVLAGRALLPILNPVTMLFREGDRPAIAWVGENIPADASILINPFSWGYGIYAGNDGGYWIVPLAQRRTLPPPILYGYDDNPARLRARINFEKQVLDLSSDPAGLHALLLEQHIDYIYLGVRGGALSPSLLSHDPGFQVLYAHGGAWVFRVRHNSG
jgi:hypothetical protein